MTILVFLNNKNIIVFIFLKTKYFSSEKNPIVFEQFVNLILSKFSLRMLKMCLW